MRIAGTFLTNRRCVSRPAQYPPEREDLRGPLGRLLERRPVPAVVEQHEARSGDVVQRRDADLEGHHPVVPPVDQQDRRLDAGEVLCVVVRDSDRFPTRLDELGPGPRSPPAPRSHQAASTANPSPSSALLSVTRPHTPTLAVLRWHGTSCHLAIRRRLPI
jgi:hypothetical protein